MDDQYVTERVVLEKVRYDSRTGLVPAVVQDAETRTVLMLAYADREALKRTLATKQAWFFSRSRKEYWRKGATSGNILHVQSVRLDCDGDSVLYLVHPEGPACHTGATTCFFREILHDEGSVTEDRTAMETMTDDTQVHRDQEKVEAHSPSAGAPAFEQLSELWNTIDTRFTTRPDGSYTTYLLTHGTDKIGKKMLEEAAEVLIAAKNQESSQSGASLELVKESADLLYHLFVLWRKCDVHPNDVFQVLQERNSK